MKAPLRVTRIVRQDPGKASVTRIVRQDPGKASVTQIGLSRCDGAARPEGGVNRIVRAGLKKVRAPAA